MTEDYDAVVYDLDGTLVRLDVDWGTVRTEVDAALRDRGVDTDGMDLWEMLDLSGETGHRDAVEEIIAAHERAGAESAETLALLEEFPLDVPVGVVSLNCEASVRIALERHGVEDHVDAVAGRDTLETYKPDPQPLLWVATQLDADPGQSLFVGDSESDRVAADRAGFDFQWVRERHSR